MGDRAAFDLSAPRTVHVVAIGGAGMSAIARYLQALGHRVSGSDQRDSKLLARLASEDIRTIVGHAAANLPDRCDALAISTAVRDTNVEVIEARRRGIPVLSRADMLSLLVATSPKALAVSGTHGKTTTTGMVTAALRAGAWHPSFIAGGVVVDLGTNAAHDSGDWIVVEADESDGTFLRLPRDAVIVTNIDTDHLDRWGTFDNLVAGFEEFVGAATGPRVVCVDDPVGARLAAATGAVTYGFSESARYRASNYSVELTGSWFELAIDGGPATPVWLRMHGRHNVLNATGAAALALELGVPFGAVHEGLTEFNGMARRFEFRGGANGAPLFDDYAHTASEIAATLALARESLDTVIEDEPLNHGYEPPPKGRLVAVCQPHRYTRISRHWQEFGDAFVDADLVIVTGLDGASEDPIDGVSGELVANAVRDRHPETPVIYLPEWDQLRELPWRDARPHDLIVTLGCGDITRVHDEWLLEAQKRGEVP